MLLLFLPLLTEASDFYSYIPFLYKVPEGSAGVFKNGNQFYDDVYPAGVYPIWPSDEGFVVSIMPERAKATDIPCVTADRVIITFPQMTVRYQVSEQGVLGLIKRYGPGFVKTLIINPLKQGVTRLCASMTSAAIHHEEFAMLKDDLGHYLAGQQRDKGVGISICHLDIEFPRVPDVIIENHAGHNPDQKSQTPTICQQPYEIFYTLENEQAAFNRLCGPVGQFDEPYQGPVSAGDSATVLESVIEDELAGGLSRVNTNDIGQGDYESPKADWSIQGTMDPFIDGQLFGGEDAEPLEIGGVSSSEPVGVVTFTGLMPDAVKEFDRDRSEPAGVVTVTGMVPDAVTAFDRNLPSGLLNKVPDQERNNETLYLQMQDPKRPWKHNNSRLYLLGDW